MLSVPFSTSGLHYSRWQSGGICQVLSNEAFTLFCHDVHGFTEDVHSLSICSFYRAHVFVCCLVVSDSLRGRSLHAMLEFESPAVIVKLFSTFSSFPCFLHIFDHLFGIRLGALEVCYILVR